MSSENHPAAEELNLSSQAVISILELFGLYGIDETVRGTPFNMFEESENTYKVFGVERTASGKRITPPAEKLPIQNATRQPPVVSAAKETVSEAGKLYNNVVSLEELVSVLRETGKNTKAAGSARHFFLTDGDTSCPDIMIVCDHPTSDEEMNGTAGTGKEREFIKSVITAAGLSGVKICTYNICPWRPAGERSLADDEIQICTAAVSTVLSLVRPRAVLSFSSVFNPERIEFKHDFQEFKGAFLCPSVSNICKTPLLKQKVWSRIIELKQSIN